MFAAGELCVDGAAHRFHSAEPVDNAIEKGGSGALREAATGGFVAAPVQTRLGRLGPLGGSLEQGDVQHLQIADVALIDQFLGVGVRGCEAVGLGDHRRPVGLGGGGAHLLRFSRVGGKGLFDQDVLAGLERAQGEVDVGH